MNLCLQYFTVLAKATFSHFRKTGQTEIHNINRFNDNKIISPTRHAFRNHNSFVAFLGGNKNWHCLHRLIKSYLYTPSQQVPPCRHSFQQLASSMWLNYALCKTRGGHFHKKRWSRQQMLPSPGLVYAKLMLTLTLNPTALGHHELSFREEAASAQHSHVTADQIYSVWANFQRCYIGTKAAP